MPHPASAPRGRRLALVCHGVGALALVSLLSACASKPQVSARQETSQYLSRAQRVYTPPGLPSDPWGPYIVKAAAQFDVPERWIREVMRQESGGRLYNRNGDLVTSSAGAMGLMQVMPGTYDELRGRYPDLTDDPFDPHNNIMAGTAYIREMYDIYGSPAFLAAYNAGPGRLDDHLTRNRVLPDETRRYVAAIGPRIASVQPSKPSPGEMYAMNAAPFSTAARAWPGASMGVRYAAAEPIGAAPEPPDRPAIVLNPLPTSPAAKSLAARDRAVQVAALPDAPLPAPKPEARFADVPAPAPPPRGFSLVSRAMATPAAPRREGTAVGAWAVQVGAFNNQALAAAAVASARGQARSELAAAKPAVSGVRQGSAMLYRARLGGLSRDAAAQACERLTRGRTSCLVVSPSAQF